MTTTVNRNYFDEEIEYFPQSETDMVKLPS